MNRALLLVALLALPAGGALAQSGERTLSIGLMRERPLKQALVMSTRGTSKVIADGVVMGELKSTDGLRIEVAGKEIAARSLAMAFTAKRIEVVPYGDGGFKLKPEGSKNPREYTGRLEAALANGQLLLMNRMPIEAYVAGVVSAEAGKDHHHEYYKLQAVSSRTYALTNQRKHLDEGFDLCDGVHCQVYHGRNRNDSIAAAVDATRSLVIVDSEIKLIHATFHSNCGGETMNAEDLWSKHEPYLRAVRDTFCLSAPHAAWERRLSRAEWLGYLDRRFGFVATDSAQLSAALNFDPQCRGLYMQGIWPLIHLKHVREDLKLRSTFFTVSAEGDHVLLRGRGFGHAVGLCQEGAMAMARSGRTYTDILHHYFANVHLVDLSTLDFFRDEGDSLRINGGAGPKPH
ncbi:MAG: SpoIID/LytB domain-containing protein [Flavobacteriales bacterium]|jgi:stage II sporulation protein D|nr:SpoIID/LytB domain-containing protein [Flavobacteriales bacterium]